MYLHTFYIIMTMNSVYFPIQHSQVKDIQTHSKVPTEYIHKGKVIPLQARCDPEGGQRYSSTLP